MKLVSLAFRVMTVGVWLAAAVPANAVTAREVQQSGASYAVISGPCTGLRGVSIAHLTTRCNCLQKFPSANIARRSGNINRPGVSDMEWGKCVGRQ